MKIHRVMVTWNRPSYTRLSLARLCETLPDNARVTVWDNGSSQETLDVLRSCEKYPRVDRVVYNKDKREAARPDELVLEIRLGCGVPRQGG